MNMLTENVRTGPLVAFVENQLTCKGIKTEI